MYEGKGTVVGEPPSDGPPWANASLMPDHIELVVARLAIDIAYYAMAGADPMSGVDLEKINAWAKGVADGVALSCQAWWKRDG